MDDSTTDTDEKPKRKRGRPANEMPEPIPDTMENIARAIMQGPPKKEWDYLKRREKSH